MVNSKTKAHLTRNLLIVQISIYAFIILHAVVWYGFGFHWLTKLCPFVFADQVGKLELNFAILFWVLVFGATLVWGRAFCAWGCMFGAFQDFVSRIMAKLKIKPMNNKYGQWLLRFIISVLGIGFILANKNYWPTFYWFTAVTVLIGLVFWWIVEKPSEKRNLNTVPKYVLLSQYLGGILALWIGLKAFEKGFTFVFEKYSVFYDEKWILQIGLAAVVAFGIGAVEKRIFCKYLCPIGMVLRMVSAIPFPRKYKVRATAEPCARCGRCNKECFMGLNPMDEIAQNGFVKDPNCINCLACVSKCPKNAINFTPAAKRGKTTVSTPANTITREDG